MTVETATLRLVLLRLGARRLIELGRKRRLPLRDMDEGYLVHCMMRELFGSNSPAPFAIMGRSSGALTILAYTDQSEEALLARADMVDDLWLRASCDWDALRVKEVPSEWPTGTRLGFITRVCPVVRMARGSRTHRPGAEIDAFLAACTKAGENAGVDRYETYRKWFAERVPAEAARVLGARIDGFQLSRLVRRNHEADRRAAVKQRPDVTITGELEVVDSDAFNALLRRGIGRHRAFGFGMLLLRPAPR